MDRAVERERRTLSPVRLKAWQLILAAKRPQPPIDVDRAWYIAAKTVKEGDVGYDARQLVAQEDLRPRLEIGRASRDEIRDDEPEALPHLLRIDFRSAHSPGPDEGLESCARTLWIRRLRSLGSSNALFWMRLKRPATPAIWSQTERAGMSHQ